ncbi:sensor histidine kinase [Allokutzneria sp. A3M-2-11 16]|uniref:sensor histidine kinase n=1 Tax=Allokutzneria sp. A3M-2-11 16 TaxID=2962043 RepID=UPI0020B8C859|nr:sensor histidine kinase [Allokutzneria sp. A3M-2-11 16]MCP3800360.1 sensor histidine kinase [Allokutzneria sp. A3M-2-11 16]
MGKLEFWSRYGQYVMVAIGFTVLALSTVFWALIENDPGRAPLVLGLVGLTVLWLLVGTLLRTRADMSARRNNTGWLAGRPVLSVVFYCGLFVLIFALLRTSPAFSVFAALCYPYAYALFPARWVVFAVGVTSVGGLVAQTGLSKLPTTSPFIVLVNVAVPLAFTGWVAGIESQKRNEVIRELTEVNERLETAMRVNAGLQAQLLEQARETGITEERQRMAREIHDTIAQGLTGIITQLQAADGDPEQRQRHLDNAATLARESLSEARRSVHAVRPEALESARFPDALADVVRRWSKINGVAAEFTSTGSARPLHADVEVALLRTAQEALANVAKHARAERVGLTLSYMEDVVTLDVRDDGVGFSSTVDSSGFGLTSMRQRVDGLSGTLAVESEPGSGTAISATVPAIPVVGKVLGGQG